MSLKKSKFDADAFRKQIKQVLFAVPENAYALMQSTGDTLRLVATDGFVLAESAVKAHLGQFDICLARNVLEDILRGKDVGDDDFSLPELKQLAVKQSEFPHFESVQRLKRDGPKITVQAHELLSSIYRLRPFIAYLIREHIAERPYVRVTLTSDGLHLVLPRDADSYEAEDTIDAVIRKNDYRTFGLDVERLIPLLKQLDGCVSIHISERSDYPPLLEFEAVGFRYVVSALCHGTSVSDGFPKDEPVDLQPRIFAEPWRREWKGMPVQQESEPYAVITIRFAEHADILDFGRRIGHPCIEDVVRINNVCQTGGAYRQVDSSQLSFGFSQPWEKEWQDMPEFDQKDVAPYASLVWELKSEKDVADFARRLDQPQITSTTKSAWHPKRGADNMHMQSDRCYINTSPCGCDKGNCICGKDKPQYPVYIISKGRWERRLTSNSLEEIGVPYKIVVEPQEYDQYAAVVDPKKILVLPFSNLGQGSIPARNWVWEHAKASGAKRHWILDDNIHRFYRLNHNKKIPVADATCFRVIEQFCDRYTNVALAGMNYQWLCKATDKVLPIYLNTRIYSCILIDNTLIDNRLQDRWRGRYNEDTDLSLRVMKAGLCTVLFNAFLCGKASTMTMKGGNTDELYKDDGRKQMSDSLVAQHPDVVTTSWKFNRWQHHVDYSSFLKNKLKRKPDVVVPEGANNYGMVLRSGFSTAHDERSALRAKGESAR